MANNTTHAPEAQTLAALAPATAKSIYHAEHIV
jgi:hypothetical protein